MAAIDWELRAEARKKKLAGVHMKLMRARIELQGRKLNKSGHNKFAGYNYFELGDFLPTVQQIFSDLGLCGVISYGKDEAWLTITDTEDGSSLAVCSPMSEANLKGCHPVQNLGAVQTYVRRYLWVTAMEIVEHDALDSTTGEKDAVEPAKKYAASGAGVKEEAYDSLPHQDRTWVDGVAEEVQYMFERGVSAIDIVSNVKSFIDERAASHDSDPQTLKLALWNKLPSNVRTFIDRQEKGGAKDKRKGELSTTEKEAA